VSCWEYIGTYDEYVFVLFVEEVFLAAVVWVDVGG